MKTPNLNSKYPQLWCGGVGDKTYLIISYPDGRLDIESPFTTEGWLETDRESAFAWRSEAFEAGFTFLGELK